MNNKDTRLNINNALSILCLTSAKKAYDQIIEQSVQENLNNEEFLLYLLEVEIETRKNNRIARFLKESKLPLTKNLDSFDLKRIPVKTKMYVNVLLEGKFLKKQENVLIFGRPGSGKTHLICAIAQEMIRQGHKILFTTCALLVQDLLVAKKELRLKNILKKLGRFKAIIIDDIGYVQQSREEMEILFTLLADRYESSSIMLTSNLPFSKWGNIFKDPVTAAASIDRLIHHSVILELNIPSYRTEQAAKRKAKL